MAANNQGIAHIRTGRLSVLCGNGKAHIAVPADRFAAEPLKCKRCEAKFQKLFAKPAG